MIGTLTTPLGGASLRFLNDTRVTSTGRVYFRCHVACNALLHTVTDTDSVLEVDSLERRRSSLYEVLRVRRNATPNEIKTAYRNLAKLYHPDASSLKQHDDRNFIEIHDAYATLNDPAERAMYDLKLNTGIGWRPGSYTVGVQRRGFYTSRRWETDQCW